MTRFALVELDNGRQEHFDSPYDAFKFAKEEEEKKRHSVEYVAVGDITQGNFYNQDGIVYRGQHLRYMIRLLDNVNLWIRNSNG